MLFFNYCQTFYLDRSAVKNATEVALTRVDLYIRAKPPATNNKSGITNPGIEAKIVPCLNGIPVINQYGAYRPTEPTEHGAKFAFYSGGQTARVEYDQIQASLNAVVPTTFLFPAPIFVKTDQEYGILIKFDGNENYVLWSSVQGHTLLGTDRISPGPSGKFIGNLFKFIDDPNKSTKILSSTGYGYSNTSTTLANSDSSSIIYTAQVSSLEGWDTNYLQSNWSPIPNEDLKFRIFIGRYMINGVPVATMPEVVSNVQITTSLDRPAIPHAANAASNNTIRLSAPVQMSEYIMFEMKNSTKADLYYGEPFYQDGPAYPGGTATPLTMNLAPVVVGGNADFTSRLVQANTTYRLAGNVLFNSVGGFSNIFSVGNFVIFKNGSNTYLRQIDSIPSNTSLVVDQAFDSTITGATMHLAPVGYMQGMSKTPLFGRFRDVATLYNSVVNSTVRFTSLSLGNVAIVANGTGYSNSDYIRVDGYEKVDANFAVQGNYPAYANIVTNANGSITAVYFSNTGSGYVNANNLTGANIDIFQSHANGVATENASSGSGATLSFEVNSKVKSIFSATELANCEVINIEVMRMKPEITVNNPVGTTFTIRHRTLYHMVKDANTSIGKAYYVNTPDEQVATDTSSKIFKAHTLNTPGENKTPVLTSRSNEYIIRYSNGALNSNAAIYGDTFSNTAVFLFDMSSNSDYQSVYFDPEIVNSHYGKYIINNNYTNEHTNYGEAFAKHVATKVNFAIDRVAEDALVYLTAYRPANTDIKVYARLHNSKDEEPFDDKDWTLLEIIDGEDVYSSKDNSADFIELTYNLPAYPNTDFTLDGSVTIYQGNAFVTGNNTIFGPRFTITAGGTGYANGDVVQFLPDSQESPLTSIYAHHAAVNATATVSTNTTGGITALTLVNTGKGWASQANVTSIGVLNANGTNSAGSGATLIFNPGLQDGDLIKLYSPYTDIANTNYTIAVVNSIVSNTSLTIKRIFGEISANLFGTVSINTTSAIIEGTGTFFTLDFSAGDFIAVWSNSSVYETRKISSIANNTQLTMESNGTFANTAAAYAFVTPDSFINLSTNVSNLKIDRLAYEHQAFNNIQNDNVCRYYNTSRVVFDGYDTMQLKVVLLSDNDIVVPKVDDIRGIAVSA